MTENSVAFERLDADQIRMFKLFHPLAFEKNTEAASNQTRFVHYGSIDQTDGISFTEKEYQYAVQTGKAVLAFVLDDPTKLPQDKIDDDPETISRLDTFRSHVMTGRIVRHWKDRESLKYAVFTSLIAAFDELPSVGWIRASSAASEDLLSQINDLRIRNDELEDANAKLKSELVPRISNVASLDSGYAVYYTYTERTRGSSTEKKSYVTMTWRTIFIAIGPHLVRAQTPSDISKHLQTFMVEKGIVNTSYPHLLSISETQIKIQLTAHGLIKNFQAQNTAGGLKEWIQLTELGQRTLYETMVIKETAPN